MSVDWSNLKPTYSDVCARILEYFKVTMKVNASLKSEIFFIFSRDLERVLVEPKEGNVFTLLKNGTYNINSFKMEYLRILNDGKRWIHFNILTDREPYIISVDHDKDKNEIIGLATNFSYCLIDGPYEIIIE